MSGIQADFSEIGKLQTLLGGAANRVTVAMPAVLDAVAESVAARQRELAPVESGELRDSIGVLRRTGNATSRSREIGSDLRQAYFTEVGTSVMAPQPWATPAAAAGVERLGVEMERLGAPW